MCFSATASFTSSALIAVVGVATLAQARQRREWLFASLPLAFALHQFIEGVIWLALSGDNPLGGLQGWGFAYLLYAQGLLPLLIPLGVLLIEPSRSRRRWVMPFLLLGAALTLYQLWSLFSVDTDIHLRGHSVVYDNPATSNTLVAGLYVTATYGALLVSGYPYIVGLGAVNLVGLLVVLYAKQYAFTSVWCAYAAVVSLLIYGHFHRRRVAQAHGRKLEH